MATITHTPVQFPVRRSAADAASIPTTFLSPQAVEWEESSTEPSRAASAVPVLAAFGALLAVAVGIAYFGREALVVLGSFLGGS